MTPKEFSIRNRLPGEAARLSEIEFLASRRFADHGFPSLARDAALSPNAFSMRFDQHEFWVAADEDDVAVGFAAAADFDGVFWLKEMSVLPQLGRRGIGTALLHAVIERARWSDYAAIGLTTFRDIPFNAPFYAKYGFMVVDGNQLPGPVSGQIQAETPENVHPSTRVLMIRRL